MALKQEGRSLWTTILYDGDAQTCTEHPVILPNSSGAYIQSLPLSTATLTKHTPERLRQICMCVCGCEEITVHSCASGARLHALF